MCKIVTSKRQGNICVSNDIQPAWVEKAFLIVDFFFFTRNFASFISYIYKKNIEQNKWKVEENFKLQILQKGTIFIYFQMNGKFAPNIYDILKNPIFKITIVFEYLKRNRIFPLSLPINWKRQVQNESLTRIPRDVIFSSLLAKDFTCKFAFLSQAIREYVYIKKEEVEEEKLIYKCV